MLKKKINGVWQNCYNAKNKVNGSWKDITRSDGQPLKRYTNGAWVRIYYPTIDLIGKSISGTSLNYTLYPVSISYLNVNGNTSTTRETCTLRLGYEPVKSGETLTMTVYMHYVTDATSSVTRSMTFYVSIVNFSSNQTTTTYSTIQELCSATSDGTFQQPSFEKSYSYTFTQDYNYVGIVMFVASRNFYSEYTGVRFTIYQPIISSGTESRTLRFDRDLTT